MTRLTSVRLALHIGRTSTAWSLIHRTDNGQTVWDRHLHAGTVADVGAVQGVQDVTTVLRQIADEIDARHGVTAAGGSPGALEGGGGRPEAHRPGRVCAADCSLCGQHLDGMPSDD